MLRGEAPPMGKTRQLNRSAADPVTRSFSIGDNSGTISEYSATIHFQPCNGMILSSRGSMQYQLVVQIKPASSDDFNRLVSWEDALIKRLATSAEVDGHDLGGGEFNIFIFTDDPSGTFHKIQGLPETRSLSPLMVAAYRPVDGDDYIVLWPHDSTRFNIA